MKKLFLALLLGGLSHVSAAELEAWATWSDFSNVTGNSIASDEASANLTFVPVSSNVTDGVLNITGRSSGGSAYVDLTGQGFTMSDGFTVAFTIKNIGTIGTGSGSPKALFSARSSATAHLLAVGVENGDAAGKNKYEMGGAFNGSTSNTTETNLVAKAFEPYVGTNTPSALVAIVVTGTEATVLYRGKLVDN